MGAGRAFSTACVSFRLRSPGAFNTEGKIPQVGDGFLTVGDGPLM
jgi:hypothetical protein